MTMGRCCRAVLRRAGPTIITVRTTELRRLRQFARIRKHPQRSTGMIVHDLCNPDSIIASLI
jgi:hypothetical protein